MSKCTWMHGCISGLILHGAFQTKFLGILYQKLSTFMLIRRGAGCFKCDFQIFGILGNYFIMVGHHIMVLLWGHAPRFLCYQLGLGAHFLMRDRSYQWLKDATSFGLLSDKSAEKLKGENSNFCQNGRIGNFQPSWAWLIFRVTSHACAKAVCRWN